jgi:hypothetical protein
LLDVDACTVGLGAVLIQHDEQGREVTVDVASRLLRRHERNYPVRELEALAILWGCEHFRHWLLGHRFIDKVEGGRLERWVLRLSPFEFDLVYRKGASNRVADALSRSGVDANPERVASDDLPSAMVCVATVSPAALASALAADSYFGPICEYLKTGSISKQSKDKRNRFIAAAHAFALRDGLLYRGTQLVVPESLRSGLLRELHEPAHFAADKLLPIVRRRFWWPRCAQDVRGFCRACVSCAQATPFSSQRLGLLQPIQSAGPWDTVALDLAGPFPPGGDDSRYILVMMDRFTKFVILVPLHAKVALLVARAVAQRLLCVFGCPRQFITDNGTEFKGEFDVLCDEWDITHRCVLPYHQQANGLVERYMQNINKLMRILVSARRDWVEALDMHALAYNASYHRAIHNTPYFLNFGRDPRFPIDNRLGAPEPVRLREFGRARAVDAAAVLKWTADRLAESQSRMKVRYDARQRDVALIPGDLVFVREEGQLPKTAPRWSGPFRVVQVFKAGLEVDVCPLHRPDTSFRVPLQRLRPDTPSELNPPERQSNRRRPLRRRPPRLRLPRSGFQKL